MTFIDWRMSYTFTGDLNDILASSSNSANNLRLICQGNPQQVAIPKKDGEKLIE